MKFFYNIQNSPEDIDLSYKMDLVHWRGNSHLITKEMWYEGIALYWVEHLNKRQIIEINGFGPSKLMSLYLSDYEKNNVKS